MLRRFGVNYAIFSMALDILLTCMALVLATQVVPYIPQNLTNLRGQAVISPYIFLLVPVLWGISFLVLSVYDPKRIYKAMDEFQIVALATVASALLFAGLLFLTNRDFSRWVFILFVTFDMILLLGWRILARIIFRIGRMPAAERHVLIVGAGEVGQRVGQMIQDYRSMGLNLTGFLDEIVDNQSESDEYVVHVLGRVEDVREVVQASHINDVVIALPQRDYAQINELVLALHDLPVQVRVVPDYFSLALYRATVEDFGGLPMINLRDPALNDVQRLVKRIFDLALSGILTAIAFIPMAIITLLIKLDSDGPVLFRQQRVGENGRLFSMYKFRSMVEGADKMLHDLTEVSEDGSVLFKKADDPRVTNIGRFLRHTSLDELPQLFNVLKGDMSLVGPRPELPWLVGQYEPWQHKRLAVPQGMTGWWQINGRADKPLHLHTEEDLYYVQNYSLWMDIYILLKTPWVVVRGKGAY
ncbi:MAG: sugar transferase [Anaerolineales bacterium]|uniref:sugar transferase n=1 Tax=Promineifilum sp. TaxID=2664178 RepID=UPI001D24D3C6|nr:sugar transferase [Anaerolineales bacterium]MCB8934246.1 sugar transferase [Promineifilum sp.]MCO5179705.1 sugar transferase [Promineifilum sp.]